MIYQVQPISTFNSRIYVYIAVKQCELLEEFRNVFGSLRHNAVKLLFLMELVISDIVSTTIFDDHHINMNRFTICTIIIHFTYTDKIKLKRIK